MPGRECANTGPTVLCDTCRVAVTHSFGSMHDRYGCLASIDKLHHIRAALGCPNFPPMPEELLMRRIIASLALPALLLTGCYHATITTGLPASSDVISKPWAMGFFLGLVPPDVISTASQCKNGVAKVETQLSFPNSIANAFVGLVVWFMQVDVTCASSNRMGAIPDGAKTLVVKAEMTREELSVALNKAAEISKASSQAVYFVHE